jgi:hypothetical protein
VSALPLAPTLGATGLAAMERATACAPHTLSPVAAAVTRHPCGHVNSSAFCPCTATLPPTGGRAARTLDLYPFEAETAAAADEPLDQLRAAGAARRAPAPRPVPDQGGPRP